MEQAKTYTKRENARRAGVAAGVPAELVEITVTFPRFFVFQQAGFMLPVFPSVEPSANHA